MRYTKDTLGRVKFTELTQNPIPNYRPNADDTLWMQFLNVHGPLSSYYLGQLTPKNKYGFSDQLKRLYDAGFLKKPVQQRLTEYPDGHYHVYDLTQKAVDYLKGKQFWVDALRPTGAWVHQFMVASITATMDLMCRKAGYRYVPPHEYLQGQQLASYVPFQWEGKTHSDFKLTPDAVFAIDYGNESFIAYALEADRNTEPVRAQKHDRKSDKRSVRQYQNFIGGRLYKKAYLRDAKMALLYVTVTKGHARNFLDLVKDEIGPCSYIAVGVEDAFDDPFYPPKLLTHLCNEGLERAGKEPFLIDPQAKKRAAGGGLELGIGDWRAEMKSQAAQAFARVHSGRRD